MVSFVDEFIKEQADVEYCPYCFEERRTYGSCCGEVHFVKFSELHEEAQRYIAISEYELHIEKEMK
jgi:hypothetical protein